MTCESPKPAASSAARTPLDVALYRPEIPPNTGNIARLCAATRVRLHIVGRANFHMDARTARRAGLDYWPHVELFQHEDMDALRNALPQARLLFFTAREGAIPYTQWRFAPNDCLVFGPESCGLPEELLAQNRDRCLTIPMANPAVRSLNLATSVGIALYEAIRQIQLHS